MIALCVEVCYRYVAVPNLHSHTLDLLQYIFIEGIIKYLSSNTFQLKKFLPIIFGKNGNYFSSYLHVLSLNGDIFMVTAVLFGIRLEHLIIITYSNFI